MERSHYEVAKAQLEAVDQNAHWTGGARELRQAIVQLARLVDDLEERVAELESDKK